MRAVTSPEADVELAVLLADEPLVLLNEPEPLTLLFRVVSLERELLEGVLLLEATELLGDVEEESVESEELPETEELFRAVSLLATFELLEEGVLVLDELLLFNEPAALPEAAPLNAPEPERLLELGEDEVDEFADESLLASEEFKDDDEGELLELVLLLLAVRELLLELEAGLVDEDDVSFALSEPLPLKAADPLAELDPLRELEELEGVVDAVVSFEVELEVELGEVDDELKLPLPDAPLAEDAELL